MAGDLCSYRLDPNDLSKPLSLTPRLDRSPQPTLSPSPAPWEQGRREGNFSFCDAGRSGQAAFALSCARPEFALTHSPPWSQYSPLLVGLGLCKATTFRYSVELCLKLDL